MNDEKDDMWAEINRTLAEESEAIAAGFRDPAKALSVLQDIASERRADWDAVQRRSPDENDPMPHWPTEVLSVLHASHEQSLCGSVGTFTAKVRCDDGVERYAVYGEYSDDGDRENPPDRGCDVSYYDEPQLTEQEREFLTKVHARAYHSQQWYRDDFHKDLRKSVTDKGCVSYEGSRTVLSPLGKLAMGVS